MVQVPHLGMRLICEALEIRGNETSTINRMDGKDVSRMWNSLFTVNQSIPQSATQYRAQQTYQNKTQSANQSAELSTNQVIVASAQSKRMILIMCI